MAELSYKFMLNTLAENKIDSLLDSLNTLASLTSCEGLESFVTEKIVSHSLLNDLAKAMIKGNIKHS